MYYPKTAQHPLCVLALWHGQHVDFNGVILEFIVSTHHDGTERVHLTTIDSHPDHTAFDQAMRNWYDVLDPLQPQPRYADFYRHLRSPTNAAMFTRSELVDLIKTSQVAVG